MANISTQSLLAAGVSPSLLANYGKHINSVEAAQLASSVGASVNFGKSVSSSEGSRLASMLKSTPSQSSVSQSSPSSQQYDTSYLSKLYSELSPVSSSSSGLTGQLDSLKALYQDSLREPNSQMITQKLYGLQEGKKPLDYTNNYLT